MLPRPDGSLAPVRITGELLANGDANICFHEMHASKPATKNVERLANEVWQAALQGVAPQKIGFFLHLPPALGGARAMEQFRRVQLAWRGSFMDPYITELDQVPLAIRQAALSILPLDPPSGPNRPGANGGSTGTFFSRLQL